MVAMRVKGGYVGRQASPARMLTTDSEALTPGNDASHVWEEPRYFPKAEKACRWDSRLRQFCREKEEEEEEEEEEPSP